MKIAQVCTDFAEAMLKALESKWDNQKIMAHALNNTWEKVAKKYLKIYKELCTF